MSTSGRSSPRGKLIRFVVLTLTLQTWDKKKLRFMLVWLESFCTLHSSTVDSTRPDHTTVLVNMGKQEFIQCWWWPLSHSGPSPSVLHLHPDQRRLHPVLLYAGPGQTVHHSLWVSWMAVDLLDSGPGPMLLHLNLTYWNHQLDHPETSRHAVDFLYPAIQTKTEQGKVTSTS